MICTEIRDNLCGADRLQDRPSLPRSVRVMIDLRVVAFRTPASSP